MIYSLLLSLITDLPWAEAGLAGVAFLILSTMMWKIMKLVQDKSKTTVDIDFIKSFNKEMLEQIEAREQRLVDLQEKTLEALNRSATALEILADRVSTLERKKDDK